MNSVINTGKAVWKGVKDFCTAVWKGICETGTFVAKKGKESLSWIDGALDKVSKVGSVIVFVAGVIAVGATFGIALTTIAGAAALGGTVGAIAYSAGAFTVYGGMAVLTVNGTQTLSGASGYRLDGSRLTKAQAQARIENGVTNMSVTLSGTSMGMWALSNNTYTGNGASGAGTRLSNASNSVGSKLNGTVSELNNGYKIEIPNGNKPFVVWIMDECSGGRNAPYFRVSIDGKGSLTLDGLLSSDRALTQIDLTDNYFEQINNMIMKYKGRN